MSEKRKDSKGRILRTGESQRADGKYMYRYTDVAGKRVCIYSWKLVSTDKIQNGLKDCVALRDLEKEIDKANYDGIRLLDSTRITVNDLFKEFIDRRTDLTISTRSNYIFLYNKHIRDGLGEARISSVRYTDIQKTYISLIEKSNLKPSTIQKINAVLSQLFEGAVLDELIRSNPTEKVFVNLRKTLDFETEKRHALTEDEQSVLIDYVKKSKQFNKWSSLITVLLGTGLRISELLGLRWIDCNFKTDVINVTHSLLYKAGEDGKYYYRISPPKTKTGYRQIPMFDDVKKVLLRMRKESKKNNYPEFIVDGYSGFIFLNGNGKVFTPSFVYDSIQNIITTYNREEFFKAAEEKREPIFLPKFSAHNLRHTFCTRMCENEPNIKIIQDVMGHKNIRTTMDVYNEATQEKKHDSFRALEGKIKLA